MSELPRLAEDSGGELARRLIEAARAEAPRAAAVERTLAAARAATISLHVPDVPVPATAQTELALNQEAIASEASASVPNSAPIAARSSALGLVVKWLAIGAMFGAIVSIAAYSLSDVFALPASRESSVGQSKPAPSLTAPSDGGKGTQ
ncbi:MAG TPA: hypothetical protein VGM44_03725 [Polyangiaceae bacterium]|jgi:hypothetical protein